MAKRKPIPPAKSRRLFTRTARRQNRKNGYVTGPVMRGGIRL